MFEFFLSWGGENVINHCDKDGKRPLHLAVVTRHIGEEMKHILLPCLISHGVHIDAVDRDGCAAIDYCSKDSMVYLLDLFLFHVMQEPLFAKNYRISIWSYLNT